MNNDNYTIMKYIYAKYNELDSIKKYTNDEILLKVIQAKQDTLNDMEKIINSAITKNILNIE